MDQVTDPIEPVTAMLEAIQNRDRARLAAALAHDVTLSLPFLQVVREGRESVIASIDALIVGFPDVDYRVHHRYLAPGQVTDEAVLVGTSTGPFFGAVPTGRTGQLPVRIMIDHNDTEVVGITLWASLPALRTVVDVAVTIDLTRADVSSPVVAALRATIPEQSGKVIVGRSRDAAAAPNAGAPLDASVPPARESGATSTGASTRAAAKGSAARGPVPRRVQRRRAVALGSVMLVASGGIVAWVANGAMGARTSLPGPPADTSPTTPTRRQVRGPVPSQSPTPSRSENLATDTTALDPILTVDHQNKVTVANKVLFSTGSAQLTPNAIRVINQVAKIIRTQGRRGTVTVLGYADDTGSSALNKTLSVQRARMVANALRFALGGNVKVVAEGMGELPIKGATPTAAERARNRRVVFQLPPKQ